MAIVDRFEHPQAVGERPYHGWWSSVPLIWCANSAASEASIGVLSAQPNARILGSTQDAEDALQETLLAAWRGLASFQGRSSLRARLNRIATNRCLNALRDGARRPSPETSLADRPKPVRWVEPFWLQPSPGALLEGSRTARPDRRRAMPRYYHSDSISG